jgi:hypothetical protein
MKKFFLLIFGLLFSFNIFSQYQERELIIHNETNMEYLGLYYMQFEPIKDPYISAAGEVHSDYKYKYFIIKSNKDFEKIFNKDYNVKIYMVKDSSYYELMSFKIDCPKINIEMHENHYNYKCITGRGYEGTYSFKKFD